MAHIYSFEGITPVVHPSAYVHPQAVLIGDVWIAARCYVAAGAVLRADFGRIELREGANFQDNCIAHSLPDFDCIMEEDSHIGHGAVIHSCHIGRNALVGMNAVVMDYAKVEEESVVAAMSFVKIGGVVARRTLVAGVPAKVVRQLTDADIQTKSHGTGLYHELAERSQKSVLATTALTAVDPKRPRTAWQF
jgi:phenylacetic acid degradation protein